MGFAIELEFPRQCKINSNLINSLKKEFPKCEVEINKIYNELTVVSPDGYGLLNLPLKSKTWEVDIDVVSPGSILSSIYSLRIVNCSLLVNDEISKQDIKPTLMLKEFKIIMKNTGHKIKENILRESLNIFYKE